MRGASSILVLVGSLLGCTDGEHLRPAPCEDPSRDALLRGQAYDGPLYPEVLDIAVTAEHLFVCTGIYAMMVVERDPLRHVASPRPSVSVADGYGSVCQHVAIGGDRALITHRGDEYSPRPHVTLYDVSEPSAPVELSAIAGGGSWEGAAVLGGGWYAAGLHGEGIAILRETPEGLVEQRRFGEGLDNVWDLALAGEMLFVADGSGIARVDVGDPAAPRLVDRVALDGSVKDVFIGRGHVYAAAGAVGVHVLDDELALAGTVPTPGSAVMTTESEGHLIVADWSEVRAYDVTDPSAARLVTTERIDPRFTPAPFSRVLAVAADGAELFLGEWSAGVFRADFAPGRSAPDLRFEGRTLEMPKVDLDEEASLALTLDNEGDEPLAVARLEASAPFRALASELDVPPRDSRRVEILFRNDSDELTNGLLRFATNDPDECAIEIPLVANEDDLGVGDPFPPTTITDLQTGQSLTTSDLIGRPILLSYFATF